MNIDSTQCHFEFLLIVRYVYMSSHLSKLPYDSVHLQRTMAGQRLDPAHERFLAALPRLYDRSTSARLRPLGRTCIGKRKAKWCRSCILRILQKRQTQVSYGAMSINIFQVAPQFVTPREWSVPKRLNLRQNLIFAHRDHILFWTNSNTQGWQIELFLWKYFKLLLSVRTLGVVKQRGTAYGLRFRYFVPLRGPGFASTL